MICGKELCKFTVLWSVGHLMVYSALHRNRREVHLIPRLNFVIVFYNIKTTILADLYSHTANRLIMAKLHENKTHVLLYRLFMLNIMEETNSAGFYCSDFTHFCLL